ncbi:hypothetical protein GE061_003629 [Apolygus lucorum]|uniref:tRNA-t(6)A37 methylthiotransferase n=1 Tax=Apolygus lucorum TaxID=248454 RepID=A0A6A4JE84_APOLU|nr:hypothetical protein GE061_003629 [Apolygus lucorum]
MPSIIESVDDIEDLLASQDIDLRENARQNVTVRVKRPKRRPPVAIGEDSQTDVVSEAPTPTPLTSVIPGTQSVYVKTWGCTHNSSDSEYMAGLLAAYGYNLTDNKAFADLWLLNSCTVKNPAEDHLRNEISAGRKAGKHVVVAGCVSQGAPKSEFLKGLSIIGVQQIDRVVEVVEETLKGNSVRLLGQKKSGGKKLGGAPLALPKIRRNPLVEIIAINTGCLNQCTYCKTKHARGDLGSYPVDEIVSRAKEAFSEGVVELWLTSEDTGAYGRDIGTSLPELLDRLVPEIPDGCMLRVGMTNPPYILEHLEAMSRILNHPRVYSFLHVPVQSGSDSVLMDMKREYNRKDFEDIVVFLRERVPDMTIATDIICGFPTETESDFDETMSLCAKHKFPSLFINQFFPRPGTPAAKMVKVPTVEVKKRTKRLTELFYSYEPYGQMVGRICDVLVTEEAYDGQHYVGHNKSYHQVLVPKDEALMGKLVRVKIVSASKFSIVGEVVDVTTLHHRQLLETPPRSGLVSLTRSSIYSAVALLILIIARFIWVFL